MMAASPEVAPHEGAADHLGLRITWACVSPHSACLVPLRRGGRAPPGPVPPRGTSECLREHRDSRGTVYSLSPAKCRVRQRLAVSAAESASGGAEGVGAVARPAG